MEEIIPFIIWGVILFGGAAMVLRAFWKAERGNRLRPMADARRMDGDTPSKNAVEIEKSRQRALGCGGGFGLG